MNEIAGGLILGMFKYTCSEPETCLDENQDKELFNPDGIQIAYVLSNFCNKYHPDYVHLSKESIELNKQRFKEYNNNRGRKKKEKKKKNKKKNNGTNDEFGSCITFGVIYNGRIHGVKMFRKKSGNISKLTYHDINNKGYVEDMLGVLFDYINERKPVNIKYESHYVALANITGRYNLPPDHIINLYLLREKMNLGKYTPEYWDCRNIIYDFNGKVNHFKFVISENFDDKTIGIKLSPEGKIHVYGSSDNTIASKYMQKLIELLDEHKDEIVIHGIRASAKPKPRPDFTQKLDY